jgi:hypothetical protein
LSAGQHTTFAGPPTAIGQYGISWQNKTAYWDRYRKEFQFMAKAQGGGAASHWIYSEASGAWRSTTLDLVPGQAGHIWNVAFDEKKGNYYYLDFDTNNFVRKMDRGTENGQGSANNPWTRTSTATGFNLRISKPESGPGYHPNLYGQGDGGLIVWCGRTLAAWRESTDTWELMASYGSSSVYYVKQNCAEVYIPGLDKLIIGSGKRSGVLQDDFMVVSAGNNGSLATMQPPTYVGPIPVVGQTSGHLPWGKLVLDPNNNSRVLILEAGPQRSGLRVWSSVNAGQSWKLEPYDHPFNNLPWTGGDAGAWTVGSCTTHGVLWGMAYDGSTSQSILWKPNS